MIVLNSTKELIQVSHWADILDRPGFTQDLDPNSHTLSVIIGSYAFGDKVRCGLSNCHTPHNKGYIAVTTDGRETNMGTVCGKSYFGVDFETLTRKFDLDLQEKRDRDTLWAFRFNLEEFKQKIEILRGQDFGADWAYKTSHQLLEGSREFSEVSRKLGSMIRTGSSRLSKERMATEAEINSMELSQGRRPFGPVYIDDPIATVVGIEALYKDNDLRELLVMDLSEHIKAFEILKIDELLQSELRRQAKWVSTVEATFDRATESLVSCRKFLTAKNLEPFLQVIPDDAKPVFMRFLKQLPATQ